jgi:hypothetical protein
MSKLLMAQGSASSSIGSSPKQYKNRPSISPNSSYNLFQGGSIKYIPDDLWFSTCCKLQWTYIPCSITPRIPSSEHIMAGKIRVEDVFDFMQRSYWTSQTSLSDIDWTALLPAPSPAPVPESIIGCCCHLRSQAKTVPKEPPAWEGMS